MVEEEEIKVLQSRSPPAASSDDYLINLEGAMLILLQAARDCLTGEQETPIYLWVKY
jgi:hypothetical protein